MELPPWLKIEKIIDNLNLSGWFKGWFGYENKTYIGKLHIDKIEIILPSKYELSEVATKDSPDLNNIKELKNSDEQSFSADEKFIIEKINRIHTLNGRSDYNFGIDYGQALYHIRKKPSPNDWFVTAAVFMSNAVPDGGTRNIFNCFKKVSNPDKKDDWKQIFLTTYEREVSKITEIPSERLEPLFKKFESDLLEIFKTYELKG